jgi:hypothetical protein
MTEAELITAVGTILVQNWQYFVGIIFAFFAGSMLVAWNIARAFYRKECELWKERLEQSKEHFHQYSAIVEQRMALIQGQAKALNDLISPPPEVFYQTKLEQVEPKSDDEKHQHKDDTGETLFSQEEGTDFEKLEDFLTRSDYISKSFKTLRMRLPD